VLCPNALEAHVSLTTLRTNDGIPTCTCLQRNRAGGESAFSAVTPAVTVGVPLQTVAPAIAQSTAAGVSIPHCWSAQRAVLGNTQSSCNPGCSALAAH